MDDLDIIAAKQRDGLWVIRRWSEHEQELITIPGYEGRYTESDMYRHLAALRLTGKTFVHDAEGFHLVP